MAILISSESRNGRGECVDLKNEPAVILADQFGHKLNLRDHSIIKFQKLYKQKNNIPAFEWLDEARRREFEDTIISRYSVLYKQIYGEEFVYPSNEIGRARLSAIIEIAAKQLEE